VVTDPGGNLYVGDFMNGTIRKITPAGAVSTFAGLAGDQALKDGVGSEARFGIPGGMAMDAAGNLYVADEDTIRKVTPDAAVTTLAGSDPGLGIADGTGRAALFSGPDGIVVDNAGSIFVAEYESNTIRKVTPAGVVTTLAGSAQFNDVGVAIGGSADGAGSAARFNSPRGAALDKAGNLYVADAGNHTIRKLTPADIVTTVAGSPGVAGSADGTGSAAQFNTLRGLAVDPAGNIYVTDLDDATIRKVTPAGVVTTLAGLAGLSGSDDGTNSDARFYKPIGIAVDGAGNLFVADSGNQTIRKITSAGVVTTLAGLAGSTYGPPDGIGINARFESPQGLAVDASGNLFVTEALGRIRKVTPDGVVTTIAGAMAFGSEDGIGNAARFVDPVGIAVDRLGNIYIADTGNNLIRKGYPVAGLATPPIIVNGIGLGFDGGSFGFNVSAPAGSSVVIEASTDLASWLPIETNLVIDGLSFIDTRSATFSRRFYRARSQ